MAKFSVNDTKELELNADKFIMSIALAEDSTYKIENKDIIIVKIKQVIIHSQIALEEINN